MKELSVLFKKEFKKSDVGCWGRIVIPKEAEKYLPSLSEKQGIVLWIRDVHSSQVWGMKYKYWANNKSRMYVLDSAVLLHRQGGTKTKTCS
ncbi:B3 domain-containing transcription factor LEC2-like isoform X2 [Argentina anserina]|uniref:B3 domain-containing transcription factor LEC2-like isoform X2 n=1 Tax=Argentina anserina TaxID=57926 RepID=UPI0021764592|nr:B3 domain-containing transcription factor LEC2-like isoform X2 [Potentilla anserina]